MMGLSQNINTTSENVTSGWFQMKRTEFCIHFVICLVIVVWCYNKWNRRHFEKLASKLKGPPSYPIIGSGLEFIGTPQQIAEKIIRLYDIYGAEPMRIWLGSSFAVTISKPEDLQIVLNSSKALEKSQLYNFFNSVAGEGLLSAPVDKWRKHRRLISPAFNAKLLEQFFPVFNEKSQNLVRNLKQKVGKIQPFDLWDYALDTTFETICQTAMGYNLDKQSKNGSEFIEAFSKALESVVMRIYKPWLHPNIIYWIYAKFTGLEKSFKTLNKLPNQVIKEMKEKFDNKNVIEVSDSEEKRAKVFLDILLELNDAGVSFSHDEIRDEVVTMMSAGSDTSAVTFCFCLLMLAIHPDIQEKVYDEIYNVFGDGDQTITIEDASKLVYLEQVIKETLRLYPIAPFYLRQLRDDVKIHSGNYTLPKGTTCIFSPLSTHHIAELYPNPWYFNPGNFDPENVKKRHKYSFIAFSGGPRGCIGSKYAMMSIKVLLSTFLRNYSVHTNIKLSDIKLKIDTLMRSVNGYPVTIQTRDRRPTYKHNKIMNTESL